MRNTFSARSLKLGLPTLADRRLLGAGLTGALFRGLGLSLGALVVRRFQRAAVWQKRRGRSTSPVVGTSLFVHSVGPRRTGRISSVVGRSASPRQVFRAIRWLLAAEWAVEVEPTTQQGEDLRTRGVRVLSAGVPVGKESSSIDLFRQARAQLAADNLASGEAVNRLIYGDNLLAMAALLAGDETVSSLRGKVDLICVDPPFDSKADYRTRIELPGTTIDQKPSTKSRRGLTPVPSA